MEEMETVVLVKYEFDDRGKVKSKCFLGNFGTIKILM